MGQLILGSRMAAGRRSLVDRMPVGVSFCGSVFVIV